MRVTDYVEQPKVWNERHKGVKTDKLDALALCHQLDRFVRGNRKALGIVLSTEDEERERALNRMREQQRLKALGRKCALLAQHPRDRALVERRDLETDLRGGA